MNINIKYVFEEIKAYLVVLGLLSIIFLATGLTKGYSTTEYFSIITLIIALGGALNIILRLIFYSDSNNMVFKFSNSQCKLCVILSPLIVTLIMTFIIDIILIVFFTTINATDQSVNYNFSQIILDSYNKEIFFAKYTLIIIAYLSSIIIRNRFLIILANLLLLINYLFIDTVFDRSSLVQLFYFFTIFNVVLLIITILVTLYDYHLFFKEHQFNKLIRNRILFIYTYIYISILIYSVIIENDRFYGDKLLVERVYIIIINIIILMIIKFLAHKLYVNIKIKELLSAVIIFSFLFFSVNSLLQSTDSLSNYYLFETFAIKINKNDVVEKYVDDNSIKTVFNLNAITNEDIELMFLSGSIFSHAIPLSESETVFSLDTDITFSTCTLINNMILIINEDTASEKEINTCISNISGFVVPSDDSIFSDPIYRVDNKTYENIVRTLVDHNSPHFKNETDLSIWSILLVDDAIEYEGYASVEAEAFNKISNILKGVK